MISAILLAAGESKRLKGENKLVKTFKKKPLIHHSLKSLQKSKVKKIIIVLGFQSREVKKKIKKKKNIRQKLLKVFQKLKNFQSIIMVILGMIYVEDLI